MCLKTIHVVACQGSSHLATCHPSPRLCNQCAQNASLYGGQLPSCCLAPDSSSLLGEIFPCSEYLVNFLILQACASYGSRPAPLVYLPTHPHLPTMGREAGLHLQHEGSYAVHCPVSVMGRDLLAVGHCHTLEMLTSLHLFSFL